MKYDAYPKDWVDNWLMIIDEGPSFQGWQVEFGLADGSEVAAFAPKVGGWPALKEEPVRTEEPKANCTCLELTDDVGYLRVRSFGRTINSRESVRGICQKRSEQDQGIPQSF